MLVSVHSMVCWRALKFLIKLWPDHRIGLDRYQGTFSKVSAGRRCLFSVGTRSCSSSKCGADRLLSIRSFIQSDERHIYTEGTYTRFIRLAANPAPKPLSILTTVMPDAHELSIARSAASPLKLAP